MFIFKYLKLRKIVLYLSKKPRLIGYLIVLCFSLGVGFLAIFLYATETSPANFLSLFGVAVLIACARFGVGGLLGFLFGLPKSLHPPNSSGKNPPLTDNQSVAKPRSLSYGGNTNLEDISDWLTKILVGVGLTQIRPILNRITQFSDFASKGLDGKDRGKVVAISILIYFLSCAFITAYLWARLSLPNMFDVAENPQPQPKKAVIKSIKNLLKVFVQNLYKSLQSSLAASKGETFGELFQTEDDWKPGFLTNEKKTLRLAKFKMI